MTEVFNPKQLDSIVKIQESRSNEYALKIVETFLTKKEERLSELQGFSNSFGSRDFSKWVHTLRASALSIGAERLAALLGNIESDDTHLNFCETQAMIIFEVNQLCEQLIAYRARLRS